MIENTFPNNWRILLSEEHGESSSYYFKTFKAPESYPCLAWYLNQSIYPGFLLYVGNKDIELIRDVAKWCLLSHLNMANILTYNPVPEVHWFLLMNSKGLIEAYPDGIISKPPTSYPCLVTQVKTKTIGLTLHVLTIDEINQFAHTVHDCLYKVV